jgi:IS5 family transposase
MKKLLKEAIESAKRKKFLREQEVKRVNGETAVQEKAIAFPTAGRLYHKMRDTLVRVAKEIGIKLRQSYVRLSKRSLINQSR